MRTLNRKIDSKTPGYIAFFLQQEQWTVKRSVRLWGPEGLSREVVLDRGSRIVVVY